MTGTSDPNRFDIPEQLARIQRMLDESDKFRAETRKLIGESDKFQAEQRKLMSEAAKFDRDRWLAPAIAVVTVLAALVAAAASIINMIPRTP